MNNSTLYRILFIVTLCCVGSMLISSCKTTEPSSGDHGGQFNGIYRNLHNLFLASDAQTRSISPENPTGGKGKGGMATLDEGTAARAAHRLGQGWKVNPYINIQPGQTDTLASMAGPGAIKHIWLTFNKEWKNQLLRIYWDGEPEPSVEVPLGDFFAMHWPEFHQISSLPVTVNPHLGLSSYWVMPFREHCTITVENTGDSFNRLYYQIDYSLTEIPEDAYYFHAQYRQVKRNPKKTPYTIVDNIEGKGQYVGTYLAHGTRDEGWWGEGEIKFYIDGDTKFPTINGTGEEDYFLGSFTYSIRNDQDEKVEYKDYTTPYAGVYKVDDKYVEKKLPNGKGIVNRFGQYRWHITDPIRFNEDLKVTIQVLGWKHGGGKGYNTLQDDLASVAYWYQQEPHTSFPDLPPLPWDE